MNPRDFPCSLMAFTCPRMDVRAYEFLSILFPPTYSRSSGFKVMCCALVLAAFVYLCLAKMRVDRVRERTAFDSAAKERVAVAYEISDRLLQGVQAIAWSIETAIAQAEGNERLRKILAASSQQSGALMEEGRRGIMSLLSPTGETDLPNALAATCRELQNDWPSQCQVVVTGEMRSLHPILRDDLYKIGREALTNSFHHAAASEIEAEFFYMRSEMRVYFRDDGHGISSVSRDTRHDGAPRGMSEMYRIARAAGVDLQIRSRQNAGTEIEIRVPASRAYDFAESGNGRGDHDQFPERTG